MMDNLFWNIKQDANIKASKIASDGAQASAESMKHNVRDLNKRVDQLLLTCTAMWSLLKEKHDLSEDDLKERIKQIDGIDGQVDGKIQKPKIHCVKCGSVINLKHKVCIFCGEKFEGDTGTAFLDV